MKTQNELKLYIKDLPDYFYFALYGELCSIHTCISVKEVCKANGFGLDTGTGAWYEALKMTCKKLNLKDFLDKYDSTDAYDSDKIDELIENKVIELLKKDFNYEYNGVNPYYTYLASQKQ